MPYSNISELPANVRKAYSDNQQRAFLGAFNSTMEGCTGKGCEGKAMAAGHSAARKAGEKERGFVDTDSAKEPDHHDAAAYVSGDVITRKIGHHPISDFTISDSIHTKQVIEDGSIRAYDDPRLTQAEAGYNPLSATDSQGCANCRWFDGYGGCRVVKGVIQPTGNSRLFMPVVMEVEEAPEIEIEVEAPEMEAEEYRETKPSFMDKAKNLLGFGDKSGFNAPSGFKMLDENTFIAWYTNPYQDRDKEWFAEKAIEEDIAYMQASGDYPVLRFWHIKGVDFGDVEAVVKSGRFAVAVGKVRQDAISQALKQYAVDHNYTLSHGFYYNPDQKINNIYHDFHTFEVSVLDAKSASNQHTYFAVKEGEKMHITDTAKRALEDALKDTGISVEDILKQGEAVTKAADEATHQNFKQVDDSRLTALEQGQKDLSEKFDKLILALSKAEMTDEEDTTGEEKKADMEKEKAAAPRAVESGLNPELKNALLADMQHNHDKQANQRDFNDLDISEKAMVAAGMGHLVPGYKGGK